MNNKFLSIATSISVSLLLSQSVNARPFTVVGFGGAAQDAQRISMFKPFSEQENLDIVDDTYNGGLAKIKAMVDSNSVSWDVIQLEDPDLIQACEEGLIEPMQWDRIGGKDIFLESATSECGVGHIIWSYVISYNKDNLDVGPQGWADFWNVEKFPGKRGLRKGAKANLEFALMADGVDPKDVYKVLATEEGINRAFVKLEELKPYVQWWEAGAQPPEWLASGDVVMTTAYNGRISNAVKEGKNFEIVWNGHIYTVDSWAVVKGSENIDKAFDFIGFASSKTPALTYQQYMPYGIPNKLVIQATPAEIANKLPTSPNNLSVGLRENTEFWVDHQDELNERFNAFVAK